MGTRLQVLRTPLWSLSITHFFAGKIGATVLPLTVGRWNLAGHVYRHKDGNTISTFQKLKTTKWMFLSSNRFIIHRKVWSLTKFWGMKTGLLRQCFLPWSVSKPPVSSVWLSPQFLFWQQHPQSMEKHHQLALLKIISFVESRGKGNCFQAQLEPIG